MRRLVLLGTGLLLLIFSNGQIISPFAALACMPLLLTFSNDTRPLSGQLTLAIAVIPTSWVIWWGVIPAPGVLYFIIAAVYGLAHWLPYCAHRLLARPDDFRSTLVFPSAYVLVEALLNTATPYGSWSSIAYAQSPSGGFAQLAALGGLPLVTFALAWTGSCAAWVWRVRASRIRTGAAIVAAALVLASLSLAPEIRARLLGDPHAVVYVALLAPNPTLRDALYAAMREHGAQSPAAAQASTALNTDLLRRTTEAAQGGARIIAWSEGAALLLKADEPDLLQRAADIARVNDVFVFPAYGAVNRQAHNVTLENRLAAITPTEGVAWVYDKAHPVAGEEASTVRAAAPVLPTLDTPFGRIGAAICHDADFPSFMRQAARRQVDLLINPANDWRKIQRLHANMAAYRAVEDGFTLARAADGVAEIVNPTGAVLAMRNRFDNDGLSLVAFVPIRRATVCPDAPTWVVLAAAVLLMLLTAQRFIPRAKRHA